MDIGIIAWLLAILTAGWFGWMANRAGRNWVLWAVGGAAFGLVASTTIIGLEQSASIPFSYHERRMDHIKWTALAAVFIAVAGWALTASLHRHHLRLWQKIRPGSGSGAPGGTDSKSDAAGPGRAPNKT
jgi:hypothetical protein